MASWAASPIMRRTPAGSATTSMPATVAEPASGTERVVRMRTAVVLPAPFGPSRPQTVPRGTANETPSRATFSPNRLTRPSTSIASFPLIRPSPVGATPGHGRIRPDNQMPCAITTSVKIVWM